MLELLEAIDPSLRSTQAVLELLEALDPKLVSTQTVLELLQAADPNLRSTQTVLELLYQQAALGRVSQLTAEVLWQPDLQELVPNSDVSTGSWSPTPLWQSIDALDSNWIASSTTPSSDTFEVGITDPVDAFDPALEATIEYTIRKQDGGGTPQNDGDTIDLTIALMEGATTIASYTATDLQGDEATTTQTLTSAQKSTISDPNALTFEVTADTTASSTARAAAVNSLKLKTGKAASTKIHHGILSGGRLGPPFRFGISMGGRL